MSSHTTFAQLTDFQRKTVEYVIRRFFRDRAPTRRFLVADEVGMGKTLVARGVIEETVRRLKQSDSGIERIDIVYICSNQAIAAQNIRKLQIPGTQANPFSTRITLLANQIHDLNARDPGGEKKVNLVALTPGTSFQKGHAGGRVQERALLAVLTHSVFRDKRRLRALRLLLQMGVSDTTWRRELAVVEEPDQPIDRSIRNRYLELLREHPILDELREIVTELRGKRKLPPEVMERRAEIISTLRHLLAKASVHALKPDLIIMDEFQRFRQLMLAPDADEATELNELANALFEYPGARVLLLSATPYKLYTLPEERSLPGGDDHYRDFVETVRFLAEVPGKPERAARVVRDLTEALAEFRDQLISGGDASPARDDAQTILRRYLCRTERPVGDAHDMRLERSRVLSAPDSSDIVSFARMHTLADSVESALSVDYWKSAPYFLNFMDGYQLSERVKAKLDDPVVQSSLRKQRLIRRSQIKRRAKLEFANSRLRALHADVADAGLMKLLWMPPSMPYHAPSGPWARIDPIRATKRLLFSSWAAAPSSIAALLSHEALRNLEPDAAGHQAQRLQYTIREGRPGGMTSLLLTLPQPGLAALCDPLEIARTAPEAVLEPDPVIRLCKERIAKQMPRDLPPVQGRSPDTWYWACALGWSGSGDPRVLTEAMASFADKEASAGLNAHLERAFEAHQNAVDLGRQPDDLADWTAMAGLASPANCAWRALKRVLADSHGFSEQALVECAAIIGEGFRSLFNRSEVMSHLDRTFSRRDQPYWQSVLDYCLAGNLQAVLDEHLHTAIGDSNPHDDAALLTMAREIADTVAFDQGRVEAFDPHKPEDRMRFNTRFAVRFGGARGTVAASDEASARVADIRRAFNSPFWPFVLASTSVGQEGVDFHWWCHALVHWNLPANVVDLEQREGRIHRFKGHAVRKNVGAAHRATALRSDMSDPWAAAFAEAARHRPADMNDLWPSWVYPGSAKIECWTPSLPLSREIEREQVLRRERWLYRLAFGQPRQEDMVQLLDVEAVKRAGTMDLKPR